MKKIIVYLCVVCMIIMSPLFLAKNGAYKASAQINDDVPFETYNDYATALGRDGEKTKLEQMIGYIRGDKNVVSTAEIVSDAIAGGGTASLKISNGDISKMTAFYSNGTLTNNDQSGAKYMKIYIKNLSGADKGLGFYYTDIAQQTIEGTAPKVDYGQEHWCLKYNAYAVLEWTNGEKTAVRSEAGLYVTIPKDFEGSISIALNTDTLELPGWYIKLTPPASNGVIELERTYMISPVIPNLTPNAVFLIGDMYFKSDSSVDDFLAEFKQTEAEDIKNIVKTTSDNLSIDYANLKIEINGKVTKSELLDMLFFKENSYQISISDIDGFNVSGDDEITDGSVLKINDGSTQYLFTLNVKSKTKKGCSGNLTAPVGITALTAFAVLAAVTLRRKFDARKS